MRTHPCVGRCSHSVSDDPCRGCGRTIEEVRDWNAYSPETKTALMLELVNRRAQSVSPIHTLSKPGPD